MKSRPIPLRLLPHTCTHITEANKNAWGAADRQEQILSHVRIEPTDGKAFSSSGDYESLSAVLFYDCCNSSPSDIAISGGDRIMFNDKEYTVLSVKKCYGQSETLHHMEAGLK